MAKKLSQSRAARLGRTLDVIRQEVDKSRDIFEDPKKSDEQKLKEINLILTVDTSEIQSLHEEITQWRENIEEKFSATQKYADLEEVEGLLEDAHNNLESLQGEIDSIDDVEDRLIEIEDEISNAEDIQFPRMFG